VKPPTIRYSIVVLSAILTTALNDQVTLPAPVQGVKADAVHKWAFASPRRSAWAREFYGAQRARGKSHHAALQALGNRWLEVLWHCLTHDVSYDETVHTANRNRALSSITA